MNAKEILDQLTDAYAHLDVLKMDHAQECVDTIPPEIRERLAGVASKYEPLISAVQEQIEQLEEQAKLAVLEAGETVKGGALQAVWVKGRVTWDTKKLDGLTILLPELNQARKVGDPTVTIRKIG